MDLLLIRHATAVQREDWKDDDLLRPLTDEGRKAAKTFFRLLRDMVPAPDRILTSPAERATATAILLHEALGGRKPRIVPELAPGCPLDVIAAEARTGSRNTTIAIVGHEPDLSQAAAALAGCPTARIKLSKGGCAWLRRVEAGYELRLLVAPKQLLRVAE